MTSRQKQPLRLRVTVSIEAQLAEGLFTGIAEWQHWLPSGVQLSGREVREIARFYPSIRQTLIDSGLMRETDE